MEAANSFAWYHFDEGDVPTAARQPWFLEGTPTVTIQANGLQIDATTELGFHWRTLADSDANNTDGRHVDRAEVQFAVQALSAAPGWASGLSPIIAAIDDTRRVLGVSVGTDLRWVNPYTGDDLGLIQANFPWLKRNSFLLIKDRSNAFQLWCNGKLLSELHYFHAPTRPSSIFAPPRFGWGHWDAAGSSTALWQYVEAGLNRSLPPQWKVDRMELAAPAPIRKVWNTAWRAMARLLIGLPQDVINDMNSAFPLITAYRTTHEGFEFSGKVLPDAEQVPWTLIGIPGDFSIVRERVRIAASTTLAAAEVSFGETRPSAEYRAKATFTLRTFSTTDPAGRVGPYIEIRNDHRAIRAEMVEITTDQFGWILTEGTDVGPVTIRGSKTWRIDRKKPHTVELQVLGRSIVLLLVDGYRVDEVPYSDFSIASAIRRIRIARNGQAAPLISSLVDIEHATADVRYTDLSRREIFLQGVSERLIFSGGCERNDHLDTLMRSHHQLQELRGTTQNLLLEIKRLSCDRDSTVVVDQVIAGWFLEHNYPEITPIFLESADLLSTILVEMHFDALNFTIDQLASIIGTYLLPMSVLELQYIVTLATFLTAPTVDAATTTLTVAKPAGFAIGDMVTFRNVANTVKEDATIINIDLVTGAVEVSLLPVSFAIGDTMRKILLTT